MVSRGGSSWTRMCNLPDKLKRELSRSATKQTFAANAGLGLSDGGNALEADFKSKMQ